MSGQPTVDIGRSDDHDVHRLLCSGGRASARGGDEEEEYDGAAFHRAAL